VHRTATTDDKKLQSSLKKLSVNNIPGIEEVNMIKDDGAVIHFNNPKVQASLAANTFAITGHAEQKQITEMLPGILNQLGAESLTHLKRLATTVTAAGAKKGAAGGDASTLDADDDDDDMPELVENFDEPSKTESVTASTLSSVILKELDPTLEAAASAPLLETPVVSVAISGDTIKPTDDHPAPKQGVEITELDAQDNVSQ